MGLLKNSVEFGKHLVKAWDEDKPARLAAGLAYYSLFSLAPLLFISLIENAFKHGISPTEPSFIDITLTEKDDEIHCVIRNSNYPKDAMDKSGSGIGLEQVRKRLELLYAGRYEWHQQISSNQKEYSSILTIKIPDNNKKILP